MCHLGYWKPTNIAILNAHDVPMSHTTFKFNPRYSSGDVVGSFFNTAAISVLEIRTGRLKQF